MVLTLFKKNESMEMLKIGDKVCLVQSQRYGDGTNYCFSEVERLTKTMAVLANGKRLINKAQISHYNNRVPEFPEYGDSWTRWQIETPEILEEHKKSLCEKKALDWFNGKKFTKEEKILIYNLFNEKDSGYSIQFDENGTMYANLKNNQ